MTNAKNNNAKNDKSNVEKTIERMKSNALCFANVAREMNVDDDLIKRSRAFARKNAQSLNYDTIRNKTFERDTNAHKIAIAIVNAFKQSLKTKIAQ